MAIWNLARIPIEYGMFIIFKAISDYALYLFGRHLVPHALWRFSSGEILNTIRATAL